MDTGNIAGRIFEQWLKTDGVTQRSIFRYALWRCSRATLVDILRYLTLVD